MNKLAKKSDSTKKVAQTTSKKTSKGTKKTREVFGIELTKNKPNELRLILDAIQALEGKKGLVYKDVLDKVIELRPSAKFALKAKDNLAKGTKDNFVNRIAKTLGGTRLSAQLKPSIQAKKFNIELQTRLTVKFAIPIKPDQNLSPQVKAKGQSFEIIGKPEFRTSDIKVNKTDKRKFEAFRKAQK